MSSYDYRLEKGLISFLNKVHKRDKKLYEAAMKKIEDIVRILPINESDSEEGSLQKQATSELLPGLERVHSANPQLLIVFF